MNDVCCVFVSLFISKEVSYPVFKVLKEHSLVLKSECKCSLVVTVPDLQHYTVAPSSGREEKLFFVGNGQ